MATIEKAYRLAEGGCLGAMQALRRLDGDEALAELKYAIRLIEEGRRKAERDCRQRPYRVAPLDPPTTPATTD